MLLRKRIDGQMVELRVTKEQFDSILKHHSVAGCGGWRECALCKEAHRKFEAALPEVDSSYTGHCEYCRF